VVESLTFAPDNLTAVGIVLYFVGKCLLKYSDTAKVTGQKTEHIDAPA
jgi:hypothetical protein